MAVTVAVGRVCEMTSVVSAARRTCRRSVYSVSVAVIHSSSGVVVNGALRRERAHEQSRQSVQCAYWTSVEQCKSDALFLCSSLYRFAALSAMCLVCSDCGRNEGCNQTTNGVRREQQAKTKHEPTERKVYERGAEQWERAKSKGT